MSMKSTTVILVLFFTFSSAISQSCLPEGITFEMQAQIDNFQSNYPGCSEIEGDVIIGGAYSHDIANLNGLNVLTAISGDLDIALTTYLTNLSGLNNLTTVGGSLTIAINGITSLNGLESLNNIHGNLSIYYNSLQNLVGLENLATIGGKLFLDNLSSLSSLAGLDNLISIGGDIWISENHVLSSLTGLEKLTSLGGGISISNNDILTDLKGLKNIDASNITSLSIYGNPLLSSCEAKFICECLNGGTAYLYISDNASGCNNAAEVEDDCEDFSVNDLASVEYPSVYPNPTHAYLNIVSNDLSIEELNIYSISGRQVIHEHHVKKGIDITVLNPGFYIVELIGKDGKIIKKLIVQ